MTTTTSWGVVIGLSLLLAKSRHRQRFPRSRHRRSQPRPRRCRRRCPRSRNCGGRRSTRRARSRCVVTDAALVITDSEAGVTARSIGDGTTTWTAPLPSRVAPVALGSLIVVASSGRLVALDGASGATRWAVERAGDIASLTSHGDIVFAAAGAEMRAWAANGLDAWRQTVDAPIVTPIAADGDLVFAGLASRKMVALDAKTGALRWTIALETTPRALLATRGRLYFGGDDGVFYAYRQAPGRDYEWRYDTLTPVIGLPTADDRRLYAAFLDNTVRAFDLGVGNQRWQRQLTSRPAAGPFVDRRASRRTDDIRHVDPAASRRRRAPGPAETGRRASQPGRRGANTSATRPPSAACAADRRRPPPAAAAPPPPATASTPPAAATPPAVTTAGTATNANTCAGHRPETDPPGPRNPRRSRGVADRRAHLPRRHCRGREQESGGGYASSNRQSVIGNRQSQTHRQSTIPMGNR